MLSDHDNNLALAGLVFPKAAINAMLAEIGGTNVASEVCAVHRSLIVIVANHSAFHFLGHRLAHLVAKDESRFVGRSQVATHGDHALALHFVAEHGNGGE